MNKEYKNQEQKGTSVSTLDITSKEFGGQIHIHNSMQILAGKSGILEIKISSKKFNLRVGDIILIKRGTPHSAKALLPFTSAASVCIDYEKFLDVPLKASLRASLGNALTQDDNEVVYLRRENESTSELFSTISRICEEYDKKETGFSLFIEGYSKILLGLLLRQGVIFDYTQTLDTKAISKLTPVLELVQKNYKTEISLEEASAVLDMNREYFCRLFKKATTISFVDYINTLRISHAKELLVSSQKSISEISDELGFSSVSYFTRVFKSITGKTPACYRTIKIF